MTLLRGFISLFQRENLLDQALQDTAAMLQQVEIMVRESRQFLRAQDAAPAAVDISAMDQLVNRYESEIRRKVYGHLSMTGNDKIYPSLVLISIVIDVERVGDYAKNIAELGRELGHPLSTGPFEEEIKRLETFLDALLPQGRECFLAQDAPRAGQLLRDAAWVNPACDRITHLLTSGAQPLAMEAHDQVALALYVRFVKRINSHWLNMLTSLVKPFDRIGFRRAPGN